VDDFTKSPALTFATDLFTIIIGMLIIGFLVFPNSLKVFKDMFKMNKLWGILLLIIGLDLDMPALLC